MRKKGEQTNDDPHSKLPLLLRQHEPSKIRVQRFEAVRVQGDLRSHVAVGTDNDDATGLGRNTVLGVNSGL
jgi:hypothetical protein